jgi:hypothetical protein
MHKGHLNLQHIHNQPEQKLEANSAYHLRGLVPTESHDGEMASKVAIHPRALGNVGRGRVKRTCQCQGHIFPSVRHARPISHGSDHNNDIRKRTEKSTGFSKHARGACETRGVRVSLQQHRLWYCTVTYFLDTMLFVANRYTQPAQDIELLFCP